MDVEACFVYRKTEVFCVGRINVTNQSAAHCLLLLQDDQR